MLELLQNNIQNCNKCSLRNIDCPYSGNQKKSDLMIIMESPSEDELLLNKPYEDRSGILFKNILSRAELNYNNIYTTYLVKCLASNSNIEKAFSFCKSWLWQEIKEINPKIIILLGKLPTRIFLKLKKSVSLKEYAGKAHNVEYLPNIILYPWFSCEFILNQNIFNQNKTLNFLKIIKKELDVYKSKKLAI